MMHLAQVAGDLLQNPNLLQSVGMGGIAWVLRKLWRLERIVDRTHRENMHARLVIAEKLGIPADSLRLPPDETP